MRKLLILLTGLTLLFAGCANKPVVVLKTNMGTIKIELNGDEAPQHTENFLKLIREQFYVGLKFHRIVPGFVIQGGDPFSKNEDRSMHGRGGNEHTIPAEIKLTHQRGSVAAARMPDQVNPEKKSNGSQFYICLTALPQLDGNYSVFGKVIEGMDVVDKIAVVKTDPRDNPIQPVIIEQVYED
jgi:cyclophilin family peptidyl-prolyl cis-trans isomerase